MGRKRKPYPENLLSDLKFHELYTSPHIHRLTANMEDDQLEGFEYLFSILTERERYFVQRYYLDGLSVHAIAEEYRESGYELSCDRIVEGVLGKARRKLKKADHEWWCYVINGYRGNTEWLQRSIQTVEEHYKAVYRIENGSIYYQSIRELNLQPRLYHLLEEMEVRTVRDLIVFLSSGRRIRQVGIKTWQHICDSLIEKGLLPQGFTPQINQKHIPWLDCERAAFKRIISHP